MKISFDSEKILVASKPIDFRCGVDGLCALVVEDMQQDPGKGMYIFYNKSLNRIKIIGWHNNGFIMVYKRLESGKFIIKAEGENIEIKGDQLNWLLLGVDWRLLSKIECKNNTYF
jgi:transposase